ncbi:HAD family hydrolase [Desulfosediminicola sp.]|uniref:HAD family hydrolase n=1 Tax=Desulfosediminicola sp. TaxID=2886825 RepID=UPI003AF28EC6
MGFNEYYSLSALLKDGHKRQPHLKVVSFDLFDTLVIRRLHDPDLVKKPVARYISELALSLGIRITAREVQQLRDMIESRHRQETGKCFDDQEACYPKFMSELLQIVTGESQTDDLLARVTRFELGMEQQMIIPRMEIVNWLRELAAEGKRVLVVSDIYLPSDHLKTLVRRAGFLDSVEEVISSADTFLAKASGKAYQYIADKFELDRTGWLHVGDNPISDGLRPTEFGIEAMVLKDAAERRRKSIVKRYINYSKGMPFWRGRALQQLMLPHEGENREQPALYREGYSFLAPIIGGFLQHIAERCLEQSITKIFFLSREGYTFKKFWEKAIPSLYPQGGLPEIEYLYVSRMALASASCSNQGLTKTNARIAFLPKGNRDFNDICRIFKLKGEGFLPHLEKYNLQPDDCLSFQHSGYDPEIEQRFFKMLEDAEFQAEVKGQTRSSGQAMLRYFEDVGFFEHNNIALVDIGWLGTIQRFLYEAVCHRSDKPRLFGFLLGATRGIEFPSDQNNMLEGVIYDKFKFDIAGSTVLYARDLFEEACRAPHPTLNGYKLTENGYELEFRQEDDDIGRAEQKQDKYFAPLQRGLIDAAPRYGAASAILGYNMSDYKPWLNYLMVSKLAFPKSCEIAKIRHKYHLDDFHGKHTPELTGKARRSRTLWDYPLFHLKYNPLLRVRLFMRHIYDRICE